LAGIVQHPRKVQVYWVHLVWAWFMFFYIITYWWWEFRLERIPNWTLPLYGFVIVYGVLLYFAVIGSIYELSYFLRQFFTIG
jgi:hypothetical protein